MTDPNNWPDPAKPGYQLNPERDGWHWLHHPEDNLRAFPCVWDASIAAWCSGEAHSPRGIVELRYQYLGPCLTPAEVAAREQAAAVAMREACAVYVADCFAHLGLMLGVQSIRELPIATHALDTMLAQARREGMEEAAQEVDCGCDIREAVLARLESQGEKRASYLCTHGDVCCALQAAAIRAAAKEVNQ